jgi:hypothetical protein
MLDSLLAVALATATVSSSPDAALEQPLSLESRGLSIERTLALIGDGRGLTLTVDPSAAGLTLDISAEGVTVRQTLERLAGALELRITRVGPASYRLSKP